MNTFDRVEFHCCEGDCLAARMEYRCDCECNLCTAATPLPRSRIAMNLYLVQDNDRWGFSLNLVRAKTEDEAIRFVTRNSRRDRMEVLLISSDKEGILWCHDESPDTRD